MQVDSSFLRPDDLWQMLGLKADQTMVHFGCGAGFYMIPAAHIVGANGHVIGIDLLPDMLAEVDSKAMREGVQKIIRTIRGNLENPQGSTLADKSADWVLIANVLHQSDTQKLLSEAVRILKPEGHIVVIEWASGATPFGPPGEKRVSPADVEAAGQALHLKLQKKFNPSPYHYGFVFTL